MRYFGVPPRSYEKPLVAQENLNDIPDKAQARTNLGVASSDDVLKAANPIGTIIAFYGTTAPYGYLPCSGQTISKSVFPDLVNFLNPTGTSATLPDLRGEFLRGWDNGRGVDPSRAVKTSQGFSTNLPMRIQVNPWGFTTTGSPNNIPISIMASDDHTLSGTSEIAGVFDWTGNETRPRNVTVLYCIKAYGTVVSQASLDVAALAASVDTKVDLNSFFGANQLLAPNGYQKLPGGTIIQWGSGVTVTGLDDAVSFPVVFPWGCRTLQIAEANSSGWGSPPAPTIYGATSLTNSGFSLRGVRILGGGSVAYQAGLSYRWLAIGN